MAKFSKHGVPTVDEVKEAEDMLTAATRMERNKKLESTMESMKDWARLNLGGQDLDDVMNSRGRHSPPLR